jgi:hypothetical protein
MMVYLDSREIFMSVMKIKQITDHFCAAYNFINACRPLYTLGIHVCLYSGQIIQKCEVNSQTPAMFGMSDVRCGLQQPKNDTKSKEKAPYIKDFGTVPEWHLTH